MNKLPTTEWSWRRNSSIEPSPFRSGSSNCETLFDYAGKQEQIRKIEEQMARPGFWDNQEKAQATVAELKGLNSLVKPLDEAISAGGDIDAMVEMAEEDETFAAELPAELDRVEAMVADLELQGLLNGPTTPTGPS